MPRALTLFALVGISAIAAALSLSGTTAAQTVWSGFDVTFTKANDATPTLPENQDRITGNVWLTRDVQTGLFNFHNETSYDPLVSPVGTEWATYINNPSDTIAATNHANLDFAPWISAYGGQGQSMGPLPARLTGGSAVVHLLTDNIYLDLQFTAWTSNAGGGGFSYNRSMAPSAPVPTGDYNNNGFVDAADYVLWRNTLDEPAVPAGSGADGNANEIIDAGDYTHWRARFGNPVPAAAASNDAALVAAVPEPTSALLLLVGLLALCLRSLGRTVPCG